MKELDYVPGKLTSGEYEYFLSLPKTQATRYLKQMLKLQKMISVGFINQQGSKTKKYYEYYDVALARYDDVTTCVCGKLMTGYHEQTCRKLKEKIENMMLKQAIRKLKEEAVDAKEN